jgi:beta-lactamase superfamily II metal-dependent hydrolase
MPKFAARGDVYLRDITDRTKKIKQIFWGDWLNVEEETDDGWSKIKWGRELYWIRTRDCQDERPLEVVFVDVGQGDGCLLVTPNSPPDEKVMLIDAGEGDNMYRFIGWRFGKLKKEFNFHAAIITHPDLDHYNGFQRFFDQKLFSFDRVYHNGIAERVGDDLLGHSDPTGRYLTDLKPTDEDMRTLYADPEVRGRKLYPKLIHTALTSGRVGAVEMLSTKHGVLRNGRTWMPGFSPNESPELTIEILGPVVEPDRRGKPRLRWFGDKIGSRDKDDGKTKNGHSILLRLCYRDFTLLFGGDLNRPAEDFLLRHYGAIDDDQPLADAVEAARRRLRSDVMKSCHHGAADVTDEFLQAVDPFAFVVSSGDEESHVHPRPDLLGRLGRHGRGEAPLVLCTEILRSSREKEDHKQLRRLQKLDALIEAAGAPEAGKKALRAERAAIQKEFAKRNVEVYGAITVRTNGSHLAVAFRMEKERSGSSPKRWHVYWFKHDQERGFVPESSAGH